MVGKFRYIDWIIKKAIVIEVHPNNWFLPVMVMGTSHPHPEGLKNVLFKNKS
jgi:hypothetical protein